MKVSGFRFAAAVIAVLMAAVFYPPPGSAQEEIEDLDVSLGELLNLDRMLLSATGTMKTVREAPSVATVITAGDIERIGARTLTEVLETVPGLHVRNPRNNGSIGMSTYSYHIRGIATNMNPQVLVLIDNAPVTFLQSGTRVIPEMLAENISRIEVIRGPGSAVHGADAFAGTINIITKNSEDVDGSRFGFRGGSFDTVDAWGQYGGKVGGWKTALHFEHMQTEGDDSRILESDTQKMFDGLFGTDASRTPGPLDTGGERQIANIRFANEDWTFRALGFWNNLNYGAGVTNVLGTCEMDQEAYLASVVYDKKFAEDWNFNFNIDYFYHDSEGAIEVFTAGSLLPIGDDGNFFTPGGGLVRFPEGVWGSPGRTEQTTTAQTALVFTGFEKHRIRMGTGFKHQDAEFRAKSNFGPGVLDGTETVVYKYWKSTTDTDHIYIPSTTRDIWFMYLQDEWELAEKLELTTGVRYDNYSDFGGTVNPRLALVWNTSEDLVVKLLYGNAFRAPALQELYAINNPATLGNPNLDPETIQTLELAFDYRPFSRLRTTFNVFAYKIKDLIDLVEDPSTGQRTYYNTKDQDGHGFEIEAKMNVAKGLDVTGNFSWQHSEDADTGADVPDTPQLQAYFNVHWMFAEDWAADTHVHWVADRSRPDGDTREDVDDYATVNLSLRRKNIFKHVDLAVKASNIFDEDIREPGPAVVGNDYPMEGRSCFGEVRCHF